MGKEIEIKFNVGDLQLLDCILCDAAVREKMQENFRYIKMQTTYYDTEDGFFATRRQTLRLRKENERSVVTFKTPAENRARGEWEVEGEYLDEALPALIKAGAPEELSQVDAENLLPDCGAEFTRIAVLLGFADETVCELCGDIGDLLGGGRREPLCELELELKEGSEQTMLAFAAELQKKYGLREETAGKATRARALKQ